MTEDEKALAGRVPPGRRPPSGWWLLAKDGEFGAGKLVADCDGGKALPVFSGEGEAEMFAWLGEARALLRAMRARDLPTSAGEAGRRVDTDIANVVALHNALEVKAPRVLLGSETVFAATASGLSVTRNNGISWEPLGSLTGVAGGSVAAVFARGRLLLASTANGLSISSDDGASWATYTTLNGLASDRVNSAVANGRFIYAATARGLSASAAASARC